MQFTSEVYDLVSMYISETEQKDVNAIQIRTAMQWHEVVGLWWDALVYYRLSETHYHSLVDVPEGKELVFIRMDRGQWAQFSKASGDWIKIGEISQDMYKQ